MTPKQELIYRLNIKKNEVGGPQSLFLQQMVDLAHQIVEAQPRLAICNRDKGQTVRHLIPVSAGTDHEA